MGKIPAAIISTAVVALAFHGEDTLFEDNVHILTVYTRNRDLKMEAMPHLHTRYTAAPTRRRSYCKACCAAIDPHQQTQVPWSPPFGDGPVWTVCPADNV
jgi:hypothetical protein